MKPNAPEEPKFNSHSDILLGSGNNNFQSQIDPIIRNPRSGNHHFIALINNCGEIPPPKTRN